MLMAFHLPVKGNQWAPPSWDGLTIETAPSGELVNITVSLGGKETRGHILRAEHDDRAIEDLAARLHRDLPPRLGLSGRLARSIKEALVLYAAVAVLLVGLNGCALPLAAEVISVVAGASTLLKNEANCSVVAIGDCTLPHIRVPNVP